jgi:hypothetical protein
MLDDDGRSDRAKQLKDINARTQLDGYKKCRLKINELHNLRECDDFGCLNYLDFCYRKNYERPGLHFKLSSSDIDSWASGLEHNEPGVTEEVPLDLPKERLYSKGPVVRGNLTSNRLTPAQQRQA